MPERDADLSFPHVSLLKASAGSGKTSALTLRLVQFLLSDLVGKNELRNILAITFSNNAAREMKVRSLGWLKGVCLEDHEQTARLRQVLETGDVQMREKSFRLIDAILDHYIDFQVRTIDSFMTMVFKSSAIDFGYNPDFEILLDNRQMMRYAFDRFLRRVRPGSDEDQLFAAVVDHIGEYRGADTPYPWDPTTLLLEQIGGIHRQLAAAGKRAVLEDRSAEMAMLKQQIGMTVATIASLMEESGLDRNGNSAFFRSDFPAIVRSGAFPELIGKGLSAAPAAKLKKGRESLKDQHDRVLSFWEDLRGQIGSYAECYARSFYTPALRIHAAFARTLDVVKQRQEKIFIEDINWMLAGYLDAQIVPDIYFRLGETVFHYLIDEFQDTAPVQWQNLRPLVENSLAQQGSLFVVGDTKQAIYGFRDADYTIMRGLEERNPFPSAAHGVQELRTNYRSLGRILEFSDHVFKGLVRANPDYTAAAEKSGLTTYNQQVREDAEDPGYVEAVVLERDDDDPAERSRITGIVSDLRSRDFRFGDIAILTQKNEEAVRVSGWLNEEGIPFISYSNLDIRRRKITGEITALLKFLDSPIDDHAFAAFVLGDLFCRNAAAESTDISLDTLRDFICASAGAGPLYTAFRTAFPHVWERCFSLLFRVSGYFPVYDLVSEAYRVFRVFERCPDEEATLVKILEVIKEFEGTGYGSLRDFLDIAEDDTGDAAAWNMNVPKNIDAVRVMTIHKAKGLGFPAVIVLLYAGQRTGSDAVTEDVDDRLALLKLTKDIIKSAPTLDPLYRREEERDLVNRLNTLYVGFTRAREELYVIGVKRPRDGYPFDLIPRDAFAPLGTVRRHEISAGAAPDRHRAPLMIMHRAHHRPDERRDAPEQLKRAERRRGAFIHQVLSGIHMVDERFPDVLKAAVDAAVREFRGIRHEQEIEHVVTALLAHPDVSPYFTPLPGRSVFTEQEFTDHAGGLHRMDRVVVDPGEVTVVDFKTGREEAQEKRSEAQIRTYLGIAADVYGRPVTGVVISVDTAAVRVYR